MAIQSKVSGAPSLIVPCLRTCIGRRSARRRSQSRMRVGIPGTSAKIACAASASVRLPGPSVSETVSAARPDPAVSADNENAESSRLEHTHGLHDPQAKRPFSGSDEHEPPTNRHWGGRYVRDSSKRPRVADGEQCPVAPSQAKPSDGTARRSSGESVRVRIRRRMLQDLAEIMCLDGDDERCMRRCLPDLPEVGSECHLFVYCGDVICSGTELNNPEQSPESYATGGGLVDSRFPVGSISTADSHREHQHEAWSGFVDRRLSFGFASAAESPREDQHAAWSGFVDRRLSFGTTSSSNTHREHQHAMGTEFVDSRLCGGSPSASESCRERQHEEVPPDFHDSECIGNVSAMAPGAEPLGAPCIPERHESTMHKLQPATIHNAIPPAYVRSKRDVIELAADQDDSTVRDTK